MIITRKELTRQRYADLYAICRSLLLSADQSFSNAKAVVRKALTFPAPRYYINPDTAVRRLSQLRRGLKSSWNSQEQTRQWNAFNKDVMHLQQKYGLSLVEAVDRAIRELPAPSFFIKTSTAERVIYSLIKASRRKIFLASAS